jgi:hypothetical protein
VTEEELIEHGRSLAGVAVQTADEASGAPAVAWGDSFFFYGDERLHPFATIVIKDYDGFDTASDLDRPGVFRLNAAVGRQRFEELLGFSPAQHAARSAGIHYTVLDEVIPHPVYAAQGWVSILCPGPRGRALIDDAYRRAVARHRG